MTTLNGPAFEQPPEGWFPRAARVGSRLFLLGLPGALAITLALYGVWAALFRALPAAGPAGPFLAQVISSTLSGPILVAVFTALARRLEETRRPVLMPVALPPARSLIQAGLAGVLCGATVVVFDLFLALQGGSIKWNMLSDPAVAIGVPASLGAILLMLGYFRAGRACIDGADVPMDALDGTSQRNLQQIHGLLYFPFLVSGLMIHAVLVTSYRPLSMLAALMVFWLACFLQVVLVEMRGGTRVPEAAPAAAAAHPG